MIKQFFNRRGEKRSLSGVKTRLFNEVYRKIVKSEYKFNFSHSLSKSHLHKFTKILWDTKMNETVILNDLIA